MSELNSARNAVAEGSFVVVSVDPDARDLAIHSAIEYFAEQLGRTNGFDRREVMERFLAFIENDPIGEGVILAALKQMARAA